MGTRRLDRDWVGNTPRPGVLLKLRVLDGLDGHLQRVCCVIPGDSDERGDLVVGVGFLPDEPCGRAQAVHKVATDMHLRSEVPDRRYVVEEAGGDGG